MKKILLLGMAISPILIGLLFNSFVGYLEFIGIIFSLLMIIYWFWVGTNFAEQIKNPVKAILLANSAGLISLVLFLWQFVLVSDEDRNLILAALSQMFSAPLSFLSARIAILFTPDGINQKTLLVMQVVGLIIMILVFSAGYVYKSMRQSRKASNKDLVECEKSD